MTITVTDKDGLVRNIDFHITVHLYSGDIHQPIVLDLDGDGLELVSIHDSSTYFDMDGDGDVEQTGWVGADDGLLVLDRNANGTIDDISEISFVDDLEGATTDMEGLKAFDTNGNGFLDQKDEMYGEFQVWQDANQDGISQANELVSLRDSGIAAISLSITPTGDTTENATDNVITGTSEYLTFDEEIRLVGDVSFFSITDQETLSQPDQDIIKLTQAMAAFGHHSSVEFDLKDKGYQDRPFVQLAANIG